MALFIQTYTRQNYVVSGSIKQSMDVVFEAPMNTPDASLHDLLCAAYQAQGAPFFNDSKFAVAGWGGWSSVMSDGALRCIEDVLDTVCATEFELSVDGDAPKIAEIALIQGDNGSSGRVDAYYKRYESKPVDKACAQQRITANLLNKIEAKRLAADPDAKYDIRIVQCLRHDAEFVEVGNHVVPVDMVTVSGLVKWDKRVIVTERNNYVAFVGKAPYDRPTTINTKSFIPFCPQYNC